MEKCSKRVLGIALASLGTLVATTAVASMPVKVGGQLQADYANFHGDADLGTWGNEYNSSGDIRRAELYLKGEIDDVWSFQMEWDARNDRLGDTWIGFNGFDPVWVAVGHLGMPWGMENWTSSASTTFMEKTSSFAPEDGLGLAVVGHTDLMGYGFAFLLPDEETTSNGNTLTTSDPVVWGGRVTFAPAAVDGNVMHFGGSYYYGKLDRSQTGQITLTPKVQVRDTPDIMQSVGSSAGDAESRMAWGLEAAGEWGPLLAQAEYSRYELEGADNVSDAEFTEWYLQASYVLTGESRPYDVASGTFGRIKPASNMGAWEVALRYSNLDLDDNVTSLGLPTPDNRGTLTDWTLGVNWYANENIKFAANYIRASAEYNSDLKDRDVNAFAVRAQLLF